MSITLYQGQITKEHRGDPQALDVETRWPLVTIPGRPRLAQRTVAVELGFSIGAHMPVAHIVLDGQLRPLAFICEYPPGTKLPTTYWPVPLTQAAWPFVSTELVRPEFVPTSLEEAVDLLCRSFGDSYVALDLGPGMAQSMHNMLLGQVAWLEAWNTAAIEVLSLLEIEIPIWSVEQKTRTLRQLCGEWGVPLPPGLPR
jgi:hypothetical protein